MTDPITIARAQVAIENGLIDALRSQQQADRDGTTVIVSRQACDEAAEFLPALHDEVQRLRAERDALRKAADADYRAVFDAGFAASHENWNGETINRSDQRERDYLDNQRAAALAAYRTTKEAKE